ncbi:MAG: hypothetical protein ACOZBL_06050, partial [Patescibacteria group bacterium]
HFDDFANSFNQVNFELTIFTIMSELFCTKFHTFTIVLSIFNLSSFESTLVAKVIIGFFDST